MWVYINIKYNILFGVLLFTVYSIVNIIGYIKWRNQEKK